MFKEIIYEGTKIPKPTKETFVTKLDNDGFRYRIGERNSKKVLYKDLEIAIQFLNQHKYIDRNWFNNAFGKRAVSNPCNYTTIGGILINMNLAYYYKGIYKAKF